MKEIATVQLKPIQKFTQTNVLAWINILKLNMFVFKVYAMNIFTWFWKKVYEIFYFIIKKLIDLSYFFIFFSVILSILFERKKNNLISLVKTKYKICENIKLKLFKQIFIPLKINKVIRSVI